MEIKYHGQTCSAGGHSELSPAPCSASSLHEVNGYGIVLPLVQNYYPVEEDAGVFCWGFKYKTGIFEFFYSETEPSANAQRQEFIRALDAWYHTPNAPGERPEN